MREESVPHLRSNNLKDHLRTWGTLLGEAGPSTEPTLSGKLIIFDKGNGDRIKIDANMVRRTLARYPRGFVVLKHELPQVHPSFLTRGIIS